MSLDWPSNPLALFVSYAQHSLWLVSLASVWLGQRSIRWWALAWACAVVASWMTRGWLGEISGLHSLWAAAVLVAAWRGQAPLRMRRSVAAAIVLLGLILYPSALHLLRFDVYALGYFWPLASGFVALATLAWWANERLWAWGILVGVMLWAAGFRYSPNLWDMLLDVPLWITALWTLATLRKPAQRNSA